MKSYVLRRGMLITYLFLCSLIKPAAQSVSFQTVLTSIHQTGIPFLPNPLRFSAGMFDGLLYWIPTDMASVDDKDFNKRVTGYIFNLQNNNVDTIYLYIKATNSPFRIGYQNHIGVNKQYIMISCTDKIRIFKKTVHLSYKEYSSIEIKKIHLDDFYPLDNDRFLCSSIYNFHPNDDSIKFRMCIYNAKKKKIEKSFERADFNGIEFSHFPHQYIDYKNNTIAVSDASEYKIWIFDTTLSIIDSICKSDTSWRSYKGVAQVHVNTKAFFDELKVRDDTISRIEKISFLNDSTLLVSYKSPRKKNKRAVDIWQKNGNSWNNIVVGQQFSYSQKEDDTISYKTAKPNFTLSSPILFTDSCIIQIAVAQDIPEKPISRKNFREQLEIKYKNSPRKYDLSFYKWYVDSTKRVY